MTSKENAIQVISKLKIGNFKALKDVELHLKPLSYILGENSLGKSSVSQALRLIAQNFRDSDPQSFKLNLPGLKLGQFEKVKTLGTNDGFSIALGMNPLGPKNDLNLEPGTQDLLEISTKFNIEQRTFRRSINDAILANLMSKEQVTQVSSPGMMTKVPLQEIQFKTRETELTLSPTVVGAKRWVEGNIGEFTIPAGSFLEFKSANFLQDLVVGLSKSDMAHSLKAPILSASEINEAKTFIAENEQRSTDSSLRMLNVSLSDALMLHISIMRAEAQTSEYREFDLGQIYGPDVFPKFLEFLARRCVSARDIIEERGTNFEDLNGDLESVITEFAMFVDENDQLLWRDSDEIAEDHAIDQTYFNLHVDLKGFDSNAIIRHLVEYDLKYPHSWFYDFWFNPVSKIQSDMELERFRQQILSANENVTKQLHYVGPLRGDGYTIQNVDKNIDSFLPVGLVGEQLVQALIEDADVPAVAKTKDNLGQLVNLVRAGKESEYRPVYRYPHGNGSSGNSLKEALETWIQFFELGEKLQVSDLGVLGLQVFVDQKNLYHLGSGVSQILPVVTACLVAEPGSLTIIEQPELHLHPAAQQKLADFFLAISKSGRNLFIETHSEYMINRTRREVALKRADPNSIQLFFAERGDEQTLIREGNLNGSGGFEYWPKGFFSQTEDDLLEILKQLNQ